MFWRDKLAAALDASEPSPPPLPPSSVIDRGLSLIGLALLAVPLSAVTTVVTRLPLSISLGITILCLTAWTVFTWPYLGRRKAPASAWLYAAIFVMGALTVAVVELWNPYFRGFPGMGGGDGGNHIALGRMLAAGHPEVYQSMAVLPTTAIWLEQTFGMDAFVAYRTIFYLVVATPIAFMAVMTATTSGRALSFVVLALVAAFPATHIVWPLLHYYQCDGFWSQLMGLVPLFVGIGIYAQAQQRTFRICALVFAIGFCRFTYVLNLGDFLVTVAVLMVVEARDAPRRGRLILWTLAVLALGAAGISYVEIYGVADLSGGVIHNQPCWLALGTLALSALLISARTWFRIAGATLNESALRAFRMSGIFGVTSALVELTFWLVRRKETYYFVKYPLAATVVTSSAALVLVAACVSQGGSLRQRGLGLAILATGGGAGLALLALGAAPYRPSYLERADGHPPWRVLTVQADPEVWDEISRTLGDHHHFGGFMTPHWSESQTTNGAFGFPVLFRDPIHQGDILRAPRDCVFWDPDPQAWAGLRWVSKSNSIVDELGADPRSTCRSFHPLAAPADTRTICHLCFSDTTLEIPLADSPQATFTGFYASPPGGRPGGRWTDGDAKVALHDLALPSDGRCRLRVTTVGAASVEISWDGAPLTLDGRLHDIPAALLGGHEHRLEIRSPQTPARRPTPQSPPASRAAPRSRRWRSTAMRRPSEPFRASGTEA